LLENFPRVAKYKDDAFHKEFITAMNIDEIYAREKNEKRVMAKSHAWQSWEDLFALKTAIESSGYQGRKDVEGVIQALEGMSLKNSIGHPQGDKVIRKEDHAGMLDHYISRVENGRYEVKQRISKEDLIKQLPVRNELNKMPT
jgi:branched-chain amino acid transport system substrate-binding protein